MLPLIGLILAALYLLDRLLKYVAVIRFFRCTPAVAIEPCSQISVLQPILSGDPTLPSTLTHNLALANQWPMEFIWLIDEDDALAEKTCRQLVQDHPQVAIRIVQVPRGGERQSPKMLKLQSGFKIASGDLIAVLDDDTMLPLEGLDECLAALAEPQVGLVFGLPYYVAFGTWPSAFVSCFVNSNSLLTYIPYTYVTEPFTINGMFYLMRRERLLNVGGFEGLEGILADDFAVARRFSTHGFRLVQSRLRHGISTHLPTLRGYFRLLRRWFVFPRESIMRDLSFYDRIVLYLLALLPCVLPLVLLVMAILHSTPLSWGLVLISVLTNLAIFLSLNRRYLYRATPRYGIGIVALLQFLIPLQLILAMVLPQRILWRGHLIQVERGGTFRMLQHRTDPPKVRPSVDSSAKDSLRHDE